MDSFVSRLFTAWSSPSPPHPIMPWAKGSLDWLGGCRGWCLLRVPESEGVGGVGEEIGGGGSILVLISAVWCQGSKGIISSLLLMSPLSMLSTEKRTKRFQKLWAAAGGAAKARGNGNNKGPAHYDDTRAPRSGGIILPNT
ncbi:hypothetical protein VTI74DRAFT_9837 [Chaetomium olivicolor]